jgi:hypothetical protein
MFIVYLNVCLHISIWIFIGTVKKTCAENFSPSMVFLMTFSLTTSWIISAKSKNQGITEKPLKKRNFPHTVFLPCLWRFELRYLDKRWGKLWTYFDFVMNVPIYLFSQPILKIFKLNTHQMRIFEISIFLAFFTENLVKLHLKFVAQCPID